MTWWVDGDLLVIGSVRFSDDVRVTMELRERLMAAAHVALCEVLEEVDAGGSVQVAFAEQRSPQQLLDEVSADREFGEAARRVAEDEDGRGCE